MDRRRRACRHSRRPKACRPPASDRTRRRRTASCARSAGLSSRSSFRSCGPARPCCRGGRPGTRRCPIRPASRRCRCSVPRCARRLPDARRSSARHAGRVDDAVDDDRTAGNVRQTRDRQRACRADHRIGPFQFAGIGVEGDHLAGRIRHHDGIAGHRRAGARKDAGAFRNAGILPGFGAVRLVDGVQHIGGADHIDLAVRRRRRGVGLGAELEGPDARAAAGIQGHQFAKARGNEDQVAGGGNAAAWRSGFARSPARPKPTTGAPPPDETENRAAGVIDDRCARHRPAAAPMCGRRACLDYRSPGPARPRVPPPPESATWPGLLAGLPPGCDHSASITLRRRPTRCRRSRRRWRVGSTARRSPGRSSSLPAERVQGADGAAAGQSRRQDGRHRDDRLECAHH